MHISTHFVAVLPDAVVCLAKMSVCLPAALYIYIYLFFLITNAQTQWGVNLGLIDCCASNTLTETVKNKCNFLWLEIQFAQKYFHYFKIIRPTSKSTKRYSNQEPYIYFDSSRQKFAVF